MYISLYLFFAIEDLSNIFMYIHTDIKLTAVSQSKLVLSSNQSTKDTNLRGAQLLTDCLAAQSSLASSNWLHVYIDSILMKLHPAKLWLTFAARNELHPQYSRWGAQFCIYCYLRCPVLCLLLLLLLLRTEILALWASP